jgi:phosphonate transport system substrate-binding protein
MLKRKWGLLAVIAMIATLIAACGNAAPANSGSEANQAGSGNQASNNSNAQNKESDNSDAAIVIDKLTIGFVPSRDPDEIITTTEPLKNLLIKEMKNHGYDIKDVVITVGTNYEAVGEALSAGTTDVGLIPGGTYVLYDDGAEVILTATRAGLNNDSDDPKVWNENKPTVAVDRQATYYRSIIMAGPSDKGRELANKVNSGEALTFEDLNSASWGVMSSSSSAGYIYPTLWLMEHYDKSITDLSNVVQVDSYGNGFARLAAKQIDIMVAYADARRDNEAAWTSEFAREASIWDETDVIGVTPGIYNDTISVSKHSDIMDDALKAALQEAFINIAQTEEGKEVIAIYSHEGYQKAVPEDYDNEREAQKILRSMQ